MKLNIIKSEHTLNSQRYRGITGDIYFSNHKIGFTYPRARIFSIENGGLKYEKYKGVLKKSIY